MAENTGASQDTGAETPYPDPNQKTPDEVAEAYAPPEPKKGPTGQTLDAGQIQRGTDETENPQNADLPKQNAAHEGRRQQTPGTYTR